MQRLTWPGKIPDASDATERHHAHCNESGRAVTAARIILASALFVLAGLAGPAMAAEDGKISVEFNDLQSSDGGCRAVFVLHNGLDAPLDDFALRIVSFDGEGRAKLFLSLEVGALPVGKTRILRFDLGAEVACEDIGRIVLDDVIRCEAPDMGPPECLAAVSHSSRTEVPFDY